MFASIIGAGSGSLSFLHEETTNSAAKMAVVKNNFMAKILIFV